MLICNWVYCQLLLVTRLRFCMFPYFFFFFIHILIFTLLRGRHLTVFPLGSALAHVFSDVPNNFLNAIPECSPNVPYFTSLHNAHTHILYYNEKRWFTSFIYKWYVEKDIYFMFTCSKTVECRFFYFCQ